MDNAQTERRAHMLAKVRKLLAMGRDGRGNETESETAMRQANKIMAEYGIAEAECDMASITAGEMVFGEAMCGADGRAPETGKVYRSAPSYAGILAVGIGRFCDSVVIRRRTENGEMFVFRGEREDVLLSRWLLGVLVKSILDAQKVSGWTARGDANSFRVSAASALAHRLRNLASERREMYAQAQTSSGSRALMVVDRKALEVAQRFGPQRTTSTRTNASSGAAMAGTAAGKRINIPAGRPISGSASQRLN